MPRLIALFGIVMLLHILVSLPLSFYSHFVVEHQFGLSNQSLRRWLRNWSLSNVLTIALGVALNVGLFWIIWHAGPYWWLIAAAAFFVVSFVLGQLAPVLILPLFYKVEPIENAELDARMKQLAMGTGLTIEGVYRLGLSADTQKANAMLAGLGRTRRVLMGDTLLEKFSPDEIDVIFAHELGHHVHRHIPKMIATGVVVSLLGFWLIDRVLIWWTGIPTAAAAPTSALPLVMFTLTAFSLALSPLQNAISRHYERQSDRYALARTAQPHRLPLRLLETSPPQQSRHRTAPARSAPAPQPPANRRTAGDLPRLRFRLRPYHLRPAHAPHEAAHFQDADGGKHAVDGQAAGFCDFVD